MTHTHLRFTISHFHFTTHISAKSRLIITLSSSFPPAFSSRTSPPHSKSTRHWIQNYSHVRDLLIRFYPISVPVTPRTELDLTWPWHGDTQLAQPATSRARTGANINPGHAGQVARCSGVSRPMVVECRSWHAANFAKAWQPLETGI